MKRITYFIVAAILTVCVTGVFAATNNNVTEQDAMAQFIPKAPDYAELRSALPLFLRSVGAQAHSVVQSVATKRTFL